MSRKILGNGPRLEIESHSLRKWKVPSR